MNKFTKEIANILQAQIDNKPYEIQQMALHWNKLKKLTSLQEDIIDPALFPFPLKKVID